MTLIWWVEANNRKVICGVRKENGEETILIMTAKKFTEDFGIEV